MASLEALTKSYRAKKAEVAKLRRKSETTLKETLSMKRRSSSGLASIERRKESLARELAHVGQLLTQHRAQKESIARLKTVTEERLRQEQDAQDVTRQQIDFGSPDDKASAQERLRHADEKIEELRAGLKEREAAEARLGKQISDLEKVKSRLDLTMRKQTHAKPALVEQLKSSAKAEEVLRPRVQSLIKREEQAARTLQSIEKRLAESNAKRRKAKKKARRKAPKRKAARKPASRTRRPVGRKAPKKQRTRAKARTRPSKRKAPRRTSRKGSRRSRKGRK